MNIQCTNCYCPYMLIQINFHIGTNNPQTVHIATKTTAYTFKRLITKNLLFLILQSHLINFILLSI